MKRFVLLGVFILLALVLTACPSEPPTSGPKNIPDLAAENEDLSILVEALTKANLVGTLGGAGPFTVFAPTNEAFAALLTELGITKEQLLARADLADILKYHVVNASASAESLTNNQELTTLQGETIVVAVTEDKRVSLDNGRANVIAADVPASNGIIHVIDNVLLPRALRPIRVTVFLSGENQVPPLTNPGSVGGATVTLTGNTLTVDGSYSGFTATMAHVHGPATATENAGIVNNAMLDVSVAEEFRGQLTLNASQIEEFKNGLYYLNVHSAANQSGEIRGQIVPPTQ
jgi:uncharacterized surface protein with fasciclin (FAS1) repeats